MLSEGHCLSFSILLVYSWNQWTFQGGERNAAANNNGSTIQWYSVQQSARGTQHSFIDSVFITARTRMFPIIFQERRINMTISQKSLASQNYCWYILLTQIVIRVSRNLNLKSS